jgi:hypothetical protein
MLSKFISYLNKKPKHVKGLIALGTSSAITLLIGIMWAISYTGYVNEKMNSESAISFTSIYKKMRDATPEAPTIVSTSTQVASVVEILSQESTSSEETATSSEDESVKATTSSEDLIQ